jgi:hypothetical protein
VEESLEAQYRSRSVVSADLSVVFLLIVDLDRAQEGFLKIPQQAMLDLQRQLNSMP